MCFFVNKVLMSIEIDSTPVVHPKNDRRQEDMEVVAAPPGGGGMPPFCDHDVREWSRIDSITGAFERARLETDHWSATMGNTSYKYGKVIGSKNLTAADGGLRQSAKRQLEVFQGRVAGAQLHLVRTSSQWSSASTTTKTTNGGFENLQVKNQPHHQLPELSHNPLDLTSQKSRASVGRSVSRRPPTRRLKDPTAAAATNLHRVSRLCHQIHESAVRQAFGSNAAERQDGDGRVEIVELEEAPGHTNLTRTKSTSSDDLVAAKDTKSVEDLEDLEQLQTWRRTSKLRRSLQYPKQKEESAKPENSGSVRRIREDLEKGRRLNTALRNNSIDLEALDQILQSISSSGSEKPSEDDAPAKQKKTSFVTVESLKEVKGKLRRTSSPSSDIYKVEEPDDGIVTEDAPPDKETMPLVETSRVRSYVYGMEAMLYKKPSIGTGSLESRTKLGNGTNSSTNRSEDWYNRRKSYGFEQVHGHSDATNSISLRDKTLVESSTDSGICRSTEIVVVPTTKQNSDELSDLEKSNGYEHSRKQTGQVKKLASNWSSYHTEWSHPKSELKSTTITIPIAKNNNIIDLPWTDPDKETKRHSIAVDESKYVTKHDPENIHRRTSLAWNEDEDDTNTRRTKKVEFCKTEIHFAAESGKVNIVATDEKPPPTQNFRRRRRNSLEDSKNGLPVRRFGDTCFEKAMFGMPDDPPKPGGSSACGLVTVSTVNSTPNAEEFDEEEKKELENELKGILKNKPVKPRPYHLGQSLEEDNKWGVRLRHVEKPETPFWKSTVTVQNYNYIEDLKETEKKEPEFQKLLKNLRPIRKVDYTSDNDSRYFEDSRKLDGGQTVEVKGYSTKINFGEGEATVVENNDEAEADRPSTWVNTERTGNDSKDRLNAQENSTKINVILPETNYSPIASRKPIPTLRPDLEFAQKLSSPSIVNKSKTTPVPNKDFQPVEKKPHPSDSVVLRQPKRSEMTYFGVNISPKPTKKISQAVIRKENKMSDKPDSLRHYKTPAGPKQKPKQKIPDASEGPVYENIRNKYGRDFDSSILEELTKAADQILQAVNGYTDDDSHNRLSSDDEDPKKQHLETIVESKSWKQHKPGTDKPKPTPSKPRLGHSSTNSSVDSLNRRTNRAQQPRRRTEKSETTSTRATTKARRLQRASSREALLQSHGSSSEDLPAKVEVPLRKPRLVKKTKAVQLTATNGLEIKKSPSSTASRRREEVNGKAEERIMGSLPEIRHKTAVSTIRSTTEKVARDKTRYIKNEDLKKKQIQQKKEASRVSSLSSRGEREKDSRSSTVNNKETVTHRISTANIKKCYRANGDMRH